MNPIEQASDDIQARHDAWASRRLLPEEDSLFVRGTGTRLESVRFGELVKSEVGECFTYKAPAPHAAAVQQSVLRQRVAKWLRQKFRQLLARCRWKVEGKPSEPRVAQIDSDPAVRKVGNGE